MLEEVIKSIKPPDEEAMRKAKMRQDMLTKPMGSLGRLEELSIKIAGIKGEPLPDIGEKAIFTFAGDHGVVEEGVSAFPKEVTRQMVYNFLKGGAGINVLARFCGARVIVVDMGVDHDFGEIKNLVSKKIRRGTGNITKGPAMSRDEAIRSIEAGIEVVGEGLGIIGVGDMGIGNTTPSSAIASVITGRRVEEMTGRGTGIKDEALRRKIEVIKRAIEVNKPDPDDPIDVLSKVGGFEIGGICGAILGACMRRIPVVIDGFISGAGALLAYKLCPTTREYMIASHMSEEPGHRYILEYLSLKPLLNLGMRLGEGTGACLGIMLCEASLRILKEMATFPEAGVSEATD